MATVAEFTLDPTEFPLGSVFAELPEVTVELERVVPDANGVVPYLWVHGTEADDVVARFDGHPGVEDVKLVDRVDGGHLLRCRWTQGYDCILDALEVPGVVLHSAVGTAAEWTFEIRGDTRDDVAQFRRRCHDREVPVTLTALHPLGSREQQDSLTEKQREALILAYEFGYFNSPRETSLEGVADDLDISQQALASRLRRGTRRLIEHCLIEHCPVESQS